MEKLKIKPDQMQEAARAIDYLYTHNKNYTKAQEEATTILYYLFFKGLHPYKEEEPAQDPDAEKAKKAAATYYTTAPATAYYISYHISRPTGSRQATKT